jgi:4-amino-4-deoxy-L-arabinose transferase-like glycosyltransferase
MLSTYLAHLTEAFYGFGMGLGGDGVAKLLALAFGMGAVLAVFAIARRLAGAEAGMWGAILFGTTPIVHLLSTAAYADVSEAFFLASSVLALIRIRDRAPGGSFLVCAGLAGAAVGAKLPALFAAPVIAILAVVELFRRRKAAPAAAIALAGGAVSAVAVVPWYAVNFAFTGSPIYPIPSRFFPGRGLSDAMIVYRHFGLDRSWKSALAMVPALTFSTRRFGEGLVTGALGLVVPLALLVVVALAVGGRQARLAALVAISLAIGWFASLQYGRYMVPLFSIAIPAIVAVCPWRPIRLRRLVRAAFFAGIVGQALVIPVQYWMVPERFPLALAIGGESRRTFLSTVVPPYAAIEWLNGVVGPGEKVAAYHVGGVRFYCRAPMGGWDDTLELRYLPMSDPGAMERGLEAEGYRWVLSKVPRAEDVSRTWEDFLSTHARLVTVRNGFRVHRLSWGAPKAGEGGGSAAVPR